MNQTDLTVIHGRRRFYCRQPYALPQKERLWQHSGGGQETAMRLVLARSGVEHLCLDVSNETNCQRVFEGAKEVYNLAADMGGMGFIERFRVECLRSVLINTHMTEAAYRAGADRYFFSSSACAYNTSLQNDPNVRALKESDAYPALAERGYGWEKLFSEMVCQEYSYERGMRTFVARFHNVYGPHGTWDGVREKAPAAICRKMIEAIGKNDFRITIWSDGKQTQFDVR